MRVGNTFRAALLGVALSAALPVAAQEPRGVQSPILVIDSERLFAESAFGQRIADEIEEAGAALAAENRQIETELEEEEKALTEQRPDLDPDAFRDLADAFDEKVRSVRREQETKARALVRRQEAAQVRFLGAAAPVLEDLMREAGAAVVLEQRSVFLSLNAVDITARAVARIDTQIGDGTTPEEE